MGFFDDVGNFFGAVGDAVASGAEAVGDTVETVANAAGDAVADLVESTGNGLQDLMNVIGGGLSGIPGVGGFMAGVNSWLGGIVAGVTNLVGAIVKGIMGIIGGVIGGIIKVLGGILTLHWSLLLDGFIDLGASIAGAIVSILGTLGSLIQRVIPFINKDRPLTKEEKMILSIVFKRSLALYNIRIKSSSGLPVGHFTLDNTIYSDLPDLGIPFPTLVHECTHVWQYQNLGSRYIAEAIVAQWVYGRDPENPCAAGNAYDWTGELTRGTTKWEDFNKEAQAQLIKEIWTDGTLTSQSITTTGEGAFYQKESCDAMMVLLASVGPTLFSTCTEQFIASANPASGPDGILVHCPRDGNDYTVLANESVKKMRDTWNFRFSQLF